MSDPAPNPIQRAARLGRAVTGRALSALDWSGDRLRGLGSGTVASLLAVILDVVQVALTIGIVLVLIAALGMFAVAVAPNLARQVTILGVSDQAVFRWLLFGFLLVVALYLVAVRVVVSRLRRIFATLMAGDPFEPENVRRLRTIGLMLAVLEISRYPIVLAVGWLTPSGVIDNNRGINLTAWFAVLVVFVLAEVFREGARLRREAELTI